jgi:hypothetical protein
MPSRLLHVLLIVIALSALPALADGVYIPRIDPTSAARDLTEPTQKAVIIHFSILRRRPLRRRADWTSDTPCVIGQIRAIRVPNPQLGKNTPVNESAIYDNARSANACSHEFLYNPMTKSHPVHHN